ncbi:MAG: rhodanese-like domain-containing protein [Immundisolibacterales bacterium]|nr:rhodanese-like domain-containing protein [Immundisolibacterales bacterium]
MKTLEISPQELHALLLGTDELALLDLREQGAFGESHLLYASCLPLSRLELRVERLVPRRSVPVVLCDGGEGLAERGATKFAALGYTNVRVLAGGVPAWQAAGYTAFSGINVPSKAFGEYVEHEFETPSISAEELKAMMDGGESLVVLDSRPMDEFRAMSIPGGICCPGAELVHRVGDAAPEPGTTVVVNCAGRTRSIIGAQSLINAGIPNRVTALRNGTMGWHLSGYELARGREDRPPPRGEGWRAGSARAAERLADRFGVEYVDAAPLAAWRAEADARSLFIFDVRSPEEYREGHVADAVHAAGGQLVQATDEYIGTLGARVALVDDDGVRATLTASWLRQMGWDAYVVRGALEAEELVSGPGPAARPAGAFPAALIKASVLAIGIEGDSVLVVDLADSRTFRRGHLPGAWHAVRADLPERLASLPRRHVTVLTSPDGMLAALAARDLGGGVSVLDGGTAAWSAAGLELVAGEGERIADDVNDVWLRPYDRGTGVEDAMQAYLDWEIDLVAQLERDGTARFGPFRMASC